MPSVRLIDADGSQQGVVTIEEALRRAEAAGLDLVEVSPGVEPPVCRILDWGKYNYQKTKQQQKAQRKHKTVDVKQVRFGLKIGQHDLDIKLRRAMSFLEEGHKVKLTAFFRGRELAHQEIGFELMQQVLATLGEAQSIVVEQEPQLAGKQLSVVIRSK